MPSPRLGRAARLHKQFPLLPTLYIALVTLDIVEFFGVRQSPEAFGNLACMVRPLGALAVPLVPERLLDFVVRACAEQPIEPAVSIIFLMIKISLGMITFPVLLLLFAIQPKEYVVLRNWTFERLEQQRTFLQGCKDYALGFGFLVSISVVFWWTDLSVSPAHFNVRLLHKISYEDFFCGALPATATFILLLILDLIIWPLQYRFSAKKAD